MMNLIKKTKTTRKLKKIVNILRKIKTEIMIPNSYIFKNLKLYIQQLGNNKLKNELHEILTNLLDLIELEPVTVKKECVLLIIENNWFDLSKAAGILKRLLVNAKTRDNNLESATITTIDDIGSALLNKNVSTVGLDSEYNSRFKKINAILKQKKAEEDARKALQARRAEEAARIAENNAKIKTITDALAETKKYSLAANEKLTLIDAMSSTVDIPVEEKDIVEMQSWVDDVNGYQLSSAAVFADAQQAFDTLNKDTSILTPTDLVNVNKSLEGLKIETANVSKIDGELKSKLEDIKKLKIIQEAATKAIEYEEEAENFKDAAKKANDNITDNLQVDKANTYYDAANSAATKAEESAKNAEVEAKKANDALNGVTYFKRSFETVNMAPSYYEQAKKHAEEARNFAKLAKAKLEKIKKDNDEAAAAAEKAKQEAAEKERQRIADEEVEQKRLAEAEKQRLAEAEAEKQRLALAEAEKQRLAEAAEAEKQRLAEAENEKQRLAEAEAEKQRLAEAEAEKQRLTEAAEKERQRLADEQAEQEAAEKVKQEAAVEKERQRLLEIEEKERQRLAEEKRIADAVEEKRLAEERQIAAEKEAREKAEANKKKKEDAINKNRITRQRGNEIYLITYQENIGQFKDGKKRKIITMNGIEYYVLKEVIATAPDPIAKDNVILTINGKRRYFRYTKGNEDPLNIPDGARKPFSMEEFEPEQPTIDAEKKTIGSGKTKKRKTKQNRKKSKSKRKSRKKK
jgi:hypothetical protein